MMGAVVSLDALLDERRVWKGRQQSTPQVSPHPSGHAALDSALPTGGWPASALTEILIPANGSGELRLLWPSLARLSGIGERIVLVAPPYIPYPQAWLAAGVDLRQLVVIEASTRDALWAAEQCLRSGSCGAVRCCAGPAWSMTAHCAACRSPPKPGRPWPSPAALNRLPPTLRQRHCA
ncbi:Uncharacterized protein ALO40_01133 [Pseudomonas syringae pv. viburni]|uniref:Uncharacterized protein n=1 Tax=Pseudomonas syringae pv. viburni TaxID=251703 RepID=A0A0Q0CNK0_9PSED|nr:Uncharacterized protein ALO40_01133 [Pseudomonas syringae pv. viburni]